MTPADRYRRSRGLVIYWVGAQAICYTWQRAQRTPISLEAVSILDQLTEWTTASELASRIGAAHADGTLLAGILEGLSRLGFIERENDVPASNDWLEWEPEATFFHFATKNVKFAEDLHQRDRELVEKAKSDPPPPPTKHVTGARLRLPVNSLSGKDLEHALANRRTWRRFSDRAIPASALGTLLKATFGVQGRGNVTGQGPVIVRTSPSAGSRHPIEAYLLAWNVEGLAPGAYHFDSDTHEIVDLGRSIVASQIAPMLAHQAYFAAASALVVMCPVFSRSIWRYGYSRSYRTVLLDAGHLGQTFCLVATALGLAPFTTMAFSESQLEALLGLDGVSECPIYVAGVGVPDPAAGASPGRWDVKS